MMVQCQNMMVIQCETMFGFISHLLIFLASVAVVGDLQAMSVINLPFLVNSGACARESH